MCQSALVFNMGKEERGRSEGLFRRLLVVMFGYHKSVFYDVQGLKCALRWFMRHTEVVSCCISYVRAWIQSWAVDPSLMTS